MGLAGVPGLCPTAIIPLFSCTLLFTAVHWVATLNVGSGGAHASYYHRANEQVRPLIPPPAPASQLGPCTRSGHAEPADLLLPAPTTPKPPACLHSAEESPLPGPLLSSLRQTPLPSLPAVLRFKLEWSLRRTRDYKTRPSPSVTT